MNVTLGSAPDSWGVWFADDPLQTPWTRFLDEIAEAGYAWTELGPYGYLPTDPAQLRNELQPRGLQITAGIAVGALHKPGGAAAMHDHLIDVCELTAAMDARYLLLIAEGSRESINGKLAETARVSEEAWKHVIENSNQLGRITRERYGIQLLFHNEADSPVEYEDQLERYVAETAPELVSLCFDIGHFEYRGGNAAEFMRAHHDRIPYLHLKSVDPAIRDKVMRGNPSFDKAVAMGVFVEPSAGSVDFPDFVQMLREINFNGFAIVEQDMYPCDFDRPLPIAKRSREYLLALGMG